AVWFHSHQDRFAPGKDLIGRDLSDTGTSGLIDYGEQGPGAKGSMVRPASQLGDARCGFAQKDLQKPARDRQADPFGLSHRGELGLLIRIDHYSMTQPFFEFANPALGGRALPGQL